MGDEAGAAAGTCEGAGAGAGAARGGGGAAALGGARIGAAARGGEAARPRRGIFFECVLSCSKKSSDHSQHSLFSSSLDLDSWLPWL